MMASRVVRRGKGSQLKAKNHHIIVNENQIKVAGGVRGMVLVLVLVLTDTILMLLHF